MTATKNLIDEKALLRQYRDAMKCAGGWTDEAIDDYPDMVKGHLAATARKIAKQLRKKRI